MLGFLFESLFDALPRLAKAVLLGFVLFLILLATLAYAMLH